MHKNHYKCDHRNERKSLKSSSNNIKCKIQSISRFHLNFKFPMQLEWEENKPMWKIQITHTCCHHFWTQQMKKGSTVKTHEIKKVAFSWFFRDFKKWTWIKYEEHTRHENWCVFIQNYIAKMKINKTKNFWSEEEVSKLWREKWIKQT